MSDYMDAHIAADELLPTLPKPRRLAKLKHMSRNGEYCELLHVTRGVTLVKRTDHEAWRQGRTTSAVLARAELMLERARAELMGGA